MTTPDSILGALLELHGADPSATIVLEKHRGIWRERSRDELLTEVARITEGLRGLALPPDTTVLLVAEDGVSWVIADLAIQAAGLRVCAIPMDSPPALLEAALRMTRASVVIASGYQSVERVLESSEQLGQRLRVVYDTHDLAMGATRDPRHHSIAELDEAGSSATVDDLMSRAAALETAAVAVVAMGTAAERGAPPVELRHAALLRSARLVASAFDLGASDRVLAFRPLADPTDRCTTLYSALISGATLVLPESRSEVEVAMYESAPTFVHVTRRWVDQTTTTIWSRLESSEGFKGLLARVWLRRLTSGRPLSGPLATVLARYPIVEKLGLDKVRVMLVSGSALGVPERRFTSALRLPLRPAYALSEAGGVLTVADDLSGDPGACGRPLPGVALTVDAVGMIHLRDEGSGMTLDTLDSGELRDGELVLRGRRSDLSGSSPAALAESLHLEVALRGSLFVREAVVEMAADGTTVVLEPNFAVLERWAQNRGVNFATVRSLVRDQVVIDHLIAEVLRAGEDQGLRQVDRLIVLDEALDAISGALSPSGRLRRDVVLAAAASLNTA